MKAPELDTLAWWAGAFRVPLRTVSGLNVREHPMARARRVKKERQVIATIFPYYARNAFADKDWERARVVMTRVGPRELDDDAVPGALKAVRDEIAKQLGLKSDRDQRVQWTASQEKGPYGVIVELAWTRKETK